MLAKKGWCNFIIVKTQHGQVHAPPPSPSISLRPGFTTRRGQQFDDYGTVPPPLPPPQPCLWLIVELGPTSSSLASFSP